MAAHTGWLGGLKQVLSRVEITHGSRPQTDQNIVEIPNGLERLRTALVAVQNDIVEAQAERADYIQVWNDCQQEINASLAKNTTRQTDLCHRLRRLQDEWVRITQDLGIKAEVIPASIDATLPSIGSAYPTLP